MATYNHPYISSSGMADVELLYCYLCRDGFVKLDVAIYIVALVYALCMPVILQILVCELCLPVASSTHTYIFFISARNLFNMAKVTTLQLSEETTIQCYSG